jgi:hypothetical protein
MNEVIPLGAAGALTVAAIVGLGIFVYPWLLKRRGGAFWLAAITALLVPLFFAFDVGRGRSAALSLLFAFAWALGPVAAGVIVYRMQRKS